MSFHFSMPIIYIILTSFFFKLQKLMLNLTAALYEPRKYPAALTKELLDKRFKVTFKIAMQLK